MNHRILGRTGMHVSEIAFGGVEIGMPYGIGIQSEKDMLTKNEAISLLHSALESGINFFDTARIYGNSEQIMGKAFHDRRDQVILCSKCRHFAGPDGAIPSYQELKTIIEASLSESMAALRTDFLDIFMLHQATPRILANDDVSRIMADLKTSGEVRAIGVSTYSAEETVKAIEAGIWDVIQLPFNLLDQRQQPCFSQAAEAGIAIVIRSVLLKGLLSDRGRNLHPALKDVEIHIRNYTKIQKDKYPDLPTLATKFALSFEEIASVLIGIDRQQYLDQSIAVADGHYMDAASITEVQKMAYPDPAFIDLPYWDRMGWLR